MEQYGSHISFDASNSPIKMQVLNVAVEAILKVFTENYRLPIENSMQTPDYMEITFEASVDNPTFLRHLR